METAVQSEHLVHFKNFELNLRTRELYKNGIKLKLQGHPVDVLVILLEHPGELVSRDALRKRLWSDDTFVDFEHGVNSAINRLRETLGDRAEEPRFIETLPRLGYRFIAPVHRSTADTPIPSLGVRQDPAQDASEEPEPLRTPSVLPAFPINSPPWNLSKFWKRAILIAVISVAAPVVAGKWFLSRPLPPPHVKEAVQLTYGGLEKDPVGTDASKLYLNMWDQRAIALMPVAGGQIATIPVSLPGFGDLGKEPPGQVPKLMDISPDSSSLLVLDRGDMPLPEVWVVGASGQPAHYLVKATNAAWSPDGKSVVYATAHGDISLIPAEGGAPRLIASTRSTANGKTIRDLSFSPDGHTIRFTQANALWEMASDGTSFHQLLQSWNPSWWKCCGRWTPDGQFFVFLSGSIVLKSPLFLPGAQLWAIDQRIGRFRSPIQEPVQLTSGPILWGAPTPGRDSHRIFARGVTLRSRLVRYYKQSNQLEPLLGGISAEFVDFSADRKYVAYVSFPDGILWRANRDGSGAVQLTKPPFYPKLIHWSPDGTQILFTDFSPSGMEEAYVVSSLGGVPMRVLPEDNGPQRDAGWSPDGARIVFSSGSGAQGTESDEQELRILDLGSHTITSLADSEGMSSPQWSPDGRYIAALTIGGAELTAFDLQAQKWTTLRSGHYPQFPVWSRDSHSIYFLRYQDHGVFRISISGGIAERVFDLKDFRHTGWYNNWLGLDPEDSPLLLRDLGSSEIYSLTLE